MAKIGDGTLVKWNDGQDVDAVDINRNFEVIRIANNDTDDKAVESANLVDSKVKVVQDDLDNKYNELVQVDTDTNTLLIDSIADVRSEMMTADEAIITSFTTADAELQTQVDNRPTILQTDQKISDAISTVVAGNAVIPVGDTFPSIDGGRVNGEEFILRNSDGSYSLYIYNINIAMWVGAYSYIGIPSATVFTKGIVMLTDDVTGNSRILATTQRGVATHTNNATIHTNQTEKDNWNGKVSRSEAVGWQKYKTTEDSGTSIFKGSVDLNSLILNGDYMVLSNSSNLPVAADSFVKVERFSTDTSSYFVLQTLRTFDGNSYYQRRYTYNAWGPWSQDLFTSVANGKSAIASAITSKGVATASDAAFTTMATNIGNISTDPRILTGNMGTGVVTSGINASRSFTIPGLPKTPTAYKVTLENTTYINTSGTSVPYTLTSPAEFVVDMSNRSVVLSVTAFSLLFTLNGTSLTVFVQNNNGQAQSVNYSLTNFKAVY